VLKTDTIQITPEILSLNARIDEFKGAWRALGRLAPDCLSALRRVATIESIGSSTRIEGSKLSDREVEQLLSALDAAALHEDLRFLPGSQLEDLKGDRAASIRFVSIIEPLAAA
jgi:Fic family protein